MERDRILYFSKYLFYVLISFFALVIVISFFVFLYSGRDLTFEWQFLIGLSGSGIVILAFLNKLIEKNLTVSLAAQLIFAFGYFFFLLQLILDGNPYLFTFAYLLLVGASLFSVVLGAVFLALTLAYFFFTLPFLPNGPTSDNLAANLVLIFAVSALAGIFYRKKTIMKEKMVSQAETNRKNTNETILSNIGDAIYAVNANREIILFNDEAEKITGWRKEDALGLSCKKIFNFKDDQSFSICDKNCPALAVWSTQEKMTKDNICLSNGKNPVIQIESSYSPIKNEENKTTGAICVFRDVTKKKEAEKMRAEFVSTASHELRTPITAISGYIELVLNPSICKVDAKGRDFLSKAQKTAINMSNLIKNLLVVTKIDDKRLQSVISSFSIRDLVKEVIEVFEVKVVEKNITLTLDHNPDITIKGRAIGRSLEVRADKEQVREVLNNLIENAIKFTSEGGVEASISYDNDFAKVCIEDTGVGISEEGQKHLFQKFYQVDNTKTRGFGGSGLGLYITRRIIEDLGGRIWVESKENVGSKFFFTLPLAKD